jgi:putative membrane protein
MWHYGIGIGHTWLWLVWLLIPIGIGVLIVWVVWLATRPATHGAGRMAPSPMAPPPMAPSAMPAPPAVPGAPAGVAPVAPSARQILEERYARGEIDTEEFTERLRTLEGR